MIPLNDINPHQKPPLMTGAIIIVSALVFLYEKSLSKDALQRFFAIYGMVPARYIDLNWAMERALLQYNPLPFITNMFLHGGWMHFFVNMWTLWLFGDNVEDHVGHVGFLVFYILCGVIANMAHFLFNIHSAVPIIGASGAIAAVMGAYMLIFPRARIVVLVPVFFIPYFLEVPAFFYFGLWLLIQIFSALSSQDSLSSGGVAWWAHIGGFIMGVFLLSFFRKKKRISFLYDN